MKRFIYLLNAIFLLLFTKSFMFANDLESKVNYLLELSKNNISQANNLVSLLKLLTGFFAVAFISIIGFIVFKLFDLSKQISANEKVLQTIKEHGDRITTLAGEITEIRNQIRDQSLMSKGVTDEDYGGLLKEVLNWKVTTPYMNIIKNLVWELFKPEEYKMGIEKLRQLFSATDTKDLMWTIKRAYDNKFKRTIKKSELLRWVYDIKVKGRRLEDLLNEEKQKIIQFDEELKKIGEYWATIPSHYTESKRSKLWQILGDLSKKTKSDE